MAAPVWIAETASLEAAASRIGGGPLAIDTEADSFHHYRDKVCLVQLSFGGEDLLVDPLAGADVSVLGPVLADASVRKILHGADYDVRILHRDFGLGLSGIFDTMVAARLCGETAVGLGALLERHLGVVLDKRHQRADWSVRPLSAAMVAYAAEDTRHLERLARILEDELDALGRRAWAEEEFRRLESVRWRAAEDTDPEPFRRAKGAARLDRRGLAALRALWAWREEVARRRDRPPFRVLREETLMELARSRPATRDALSAIPGLPEPVRRGRGAEEILACLREAAELPEDDLPALAKAAAPPDRTLEAAVAALRKRRDEIATSLGLEPGLVASRSLLEAVAARRSAGESAAEIPDLRAWQREVLGDLL